MADTEYLQEITMACPNWRPVSLRYIYVDFDSGGGHRWNTRLIINYKIPVAASM